MYELFMNKVYWSMMVKGWEIGKNAYLFYFPYSIVVDEDLYGIVWYGPFMVAVFTLLSLYMCLPWPWRKIDEYMNMYLWWYFEKIMPTFLFLLWSRVCDYWMSMCISMLG